MIGRGVRKFSGSPWLNLKSKFLSSIMSEDRLQPDPVIEAYKRDIDRSLLRQNLKLTVEERFLKLMELQQFAAELRQAGQRAGQ